MRVPDNARRVDQRYLLFDPTEDQKQMALIKKENKHLKARLESIEPMLKKVEDILKTMEKNNVVQSGD